jgi:hypothetical protein
VQRKQTAEGVAGKNPVRGGVVARVDFRNQLALYEIEESIGATAGWENVRLWIGARSLDPAPRQFNRLCRKRTASSSDPIIPSRVP